MRWKAHWLIAGCLGLALAAAGALRLQGLVQTAWREGFAAGETAMALRQRDAVAQVRRATEAAARSTQARVAGLERLRDELQEQLEVLSQTVAGNGGGDRPCLGPDILRALARTGYDSRGADPGAR